MSAVALNRASKCVLVASTFLTAYALLAVVRLHAHHLHHGPHDFHHGGPHGHAEPGQPERPEMPIDVAANQQQAVVDPATSGLARGEGHHHGPHHHGPHGAEHGPHGPHKRCPASMLAHLALFAGLTGMASGFKPKSRRVLCYIGLLFAFEIAAVLVVLGGEVRAVRWCQQSAMMVPVQVSIMQAQVNNVNVLIAEESVGKPVKNEVFARECTHRVIHVATVSTIILGVVIGAFVACASRLLRETRAFERQAAAAAQGVVIAQPEELVVACSVEGVSEEKMSLRAHGEAI